MTRHVSPDPGAGVAPIETIDHVRGGLAGRLIVEYGDYECPYSRRAFREVESFESQLGDRVRFAFRHFPLTEIHPHALDASRAAEAAALQGRFWEMHELLFHRQQALEDADHVHTPGPGHASGAGGGDRGLRVAFVIEPR